MRTISLPAGVGVRLTATARPDRDLHYWTMRVDTARGQPLHAYRSQIGGRDVHQVIEVPPQGVDCQVELRSQHMVRDGWAEDQMSTQEDDPAMLRIGFCDPTVPGSRADDVVFSFTFETPTPKAPPGIRP